MKTIMILCCFCLLSSALAFGAYPTSGSTQDAYCVVPPYLTQNVKPNINLVLDFSGSMQFPAYLDCSNWAGYDSSQVANCGTYNTPSSTFLYNASRDYYGNFKKDLYYKYNATGGYFEENLTCSNTDRIGSIASNCLSGNLVNWISTTRTDVLRRILTGGRIKTSTSAILESEGSRYIFTDTNTRCKFTVTATSTTTRKISVANQTGYTCAIGTFSNYDLDVMVSDPSSYITGVVQSMYPGLVDLELSVYNTSISNGVAYRVGKNKALSNYLNSINSELAYNGTPTGEALREAKYYFQQSNSMTAVNESSVISAGNYLYDPYYEAGNLVAPCRKSFVLLISDGEWNGSVDPVQQSYAMRTTDLRTAISDKQTAATYAVYAFGDGVQGRQAMITTAVFGGFEDNDLNGWPYGFTSLPNSLTTTYPRPNCNPSGTWNAGCSEWDKEHTGLPYNFYEADDGDALKDGITKAVNDILGRVASGTAASVMGNNESSGALLLQALYFPEKQFDSGTKASWLGEVQSLWYYVSPLLNSINIREDTIQDAKLKLSEDRIASFDFDGTQTSVNLYVDSNGDGAADTPSTPTSQVSIDEVKALWRAGKTLWSRSASDRVIFTNDPNASGYQGSKLSFSDGSKTLLAPYLDIASNVTDAANIISYIRGTDVSGYRGRAVTIGGATNTWKLGDIINSSPRMLSQVALNSYDGYKDSSYVKYTGSNTYKQRNVAFVGANDGMLHAFQLGRNFTGTSGYASVIKNGDGSIPAADLGKEIWGFIPKSALPYLKHLGNPSYRHLYYVNSTPLIVDAAIGKTKLCPAGSTCTVQTCDDGITGVSPYFTCPKLTTMDAVSKVVSYDVSVTPAPNVNKDTTAGSSWRTVLIGSMGYGGGTKDAGASCSDCVKTPVAGIGYSSYFALDVTDPSDPLLLWEFSHPRLGFSSVGPAVMRIKDSSDSSTPLSTYGKNGHWYVVLASGPTGPIDSATNQMKALSDQPLSLFVLDLKTGTPLRTFASDSTALISGVGHTQVTAMPSFAYGGTMSDATIDTDMWDIYNNSGAYSDDALYLGYVRKDTLAASPSFNKFAKGGVLRLLTGDNPDPSNWVVSSVIDGVGPVSSSIVKLQDKYARALWIYFGTGRYNYKSGATIDEDYSGQQEAIYGIKDPCYSSIANDFNNIACTTSVSTTSLTNQTSSVSASIPVGWKINLATATSSLRAQRIITNPVSSTLGVLYFVAMKPSSDVCSYGGTTSLWGINYNTGGPISSKIKGSALLQQSTGASVEVSLSGAFTASGNRESSSVSGVPPIGPGSEPPISSNADHFPSRKVLHIQER